MSVCCGNCGESAAHICSRCKTTRYCSAQCQTKNWTQHTFVCADPEQSPKKKSLEVRIKMYETSMKELASEVKKQPKFTEIGTNLKETVKVIDGIFKQKAKSFALMNSMTTKMLREILEEKTKATNQQINFIESQLIKYGNCVHKIHTDFDNLQPGIFNELTRYYQNAWITVHAILGTDETTLYQDEYDILAEFASEILLHTAKSMVDGMAPVKDEPINGLLSDIKNTMLHNTSDILRDYANCITSLVANVQIGSVRHRKNNGAAKEAAVNARIALDDLIADENTSRKSYVGAKVGSFLHKIADKFENAENVGPQEKYVVFQTLVAIAACIGIGLRYSIGFVPRHELDRQIDQRMLKAMSTGTETLDDQVNNLEKSLNYTNESMLNATRAYNQTLEGRVELLTQVIPAKDGLISFMVQRLEQGNIPVSAGLRKADTLSKNMTTLHRIAANATSLYPIDRPNGTIVDSTPQITVANGTDPSTINITSEDVIINDFRSILHDLLFKAKEALESDVAYQDEFEGTQELRRDMATIIQKNMLKFFSDNNSIRYSAQEYASILHAMSHALRPALDKLANKDPSNNVNAIAQALEAADIFMATQQRIINEKSSVVNTTTLQLIAARKMLNDTRAQSEAEKLLIKDHPRHAVDCFFSDIIYVATYLPGDLSKIGHGAVAFLKYFVQGDMTQFFENLRASWESLRGIGGNAVSTAQWLLYAASSASTLLRILLGLNVIMFICKTVIPALFMVFSVLFNFISSLFDLQEWGVDIDAWKNQSPWKGYPFVYGMESFHHMFGLISAFFKGKSKGFNIFGTSITNVLPALLAVLSCTLNLFSLGAAIWTGVGAWEPFMSVILSVSTVFANSSVLFGSSTEQITCSAKLLQLGSKAGIIVTCMAGSQMYTTLATMLSDVNYSDKLSKGVSTIMKFIK